MNVTEDPVTPVLGFVPEVRVTGTVSEVQVELEPLNRVTMYGVFPPEDRKSVV